MYCYICKRNVATLHIIRIEKGSIKEIHICEECRAKGVLDTALFMDYKDDSEGFTSEYDVCNVCRVSRKDFVERGTLGCFECVSHFEKIVEDKLLEYHRSVRHIGRFPKGRRKNINFKHKESILYDLNVRLTYAIMREEYELAAHYRDKITSIMEGHS
jgi:protein arginine kinase activator